MSISTWKVKLCKLAPTVTALCTRNFMCTKIKLQIAVLDCFSISTLTNTLLQLPEYKKFKKLGVHVL